MKPIFVSGAIALFVSLIGTPLLIGFLRTRGIGQQIREDGPQGHFTKAGSIPATTSGVAQQETPTDEPSEELTRAIKAAYQ